MMVFGRLGRTKQSRVAPLLTLLHLAQAYLLCWGFEEAIRGGDVSRVSNELEPETLPNATHSGYLDVDPDKESKMFFVYYEAQTGNFAEDTPIIVWLQGGPGCSSMIGNFYSLGPYWVDNNLQLKENPGAWNRHYGLLFIDNPIGTGFSELGHATIPEDEDHIATDLYAAILSFFREYKAYRKRPLFIMGESYAGKYVPSLGHYILQQMEEHGQLSVTTKRGPLQHRRSIPERGRRLGPPNFFLKGLAIGNGLTDPASQCLRHADTAYYMGIIDDRQRLEALQRQLEVASLIFAGLWQTAWERRSDLLAFIKASGGLGTTLNYRRIGDYDDSNLVEKYLNKPSVQEALGARNITFVACSSDVERVLGPDVMKTVAPLIPEILEHVPLLLFQGQDDPQDGPAINDPWIRHLIWSGSRGFLETKRELWRLPSHLEEAQDGTTARKPDPKGDVVGYWRSFDTLTHVVIRNAGHMVPHDQPLVSQAMVERWVEEVMNTKPEPSLVAEPAAWSFDSTGAVKDSGQISVEVPSSQSS
eukprot:jgi/Botrbrau1/5868/Bobra.0366s0047.1